MIELFIDGDGCPVVDIALRLAAARHVPCTIVCDTAHVFRRDDAKTIVVGQGTDSADFALVNRIHKGDIVITQDYGLAAMCLARGARVLHQDGMEYTSVNIDSLLLSRHTARKIRNAGGRLKGPSKRTAEQNRQFEKSLSCVLCEQLSALGTS